MSTPSASPILRVLFCASVFFAGVISLPGCGGSDSAPVGVPGGAPVDNDEASRQKAMEDFMKDQSKKK